MESFIILYGLASFAFLVWVFVKGIRGLFNRPEDTEYSQGNDLPDPDAEKPERNMWKKAPTWAAYVLFAIPGILIILAVLAFAAFMLTISDGGGVGTFVGIFLLLGVLAFLKVRFCKR